ncbi:MAG: ferredoxin-thioredoxin reductase catalytic domain-containing protein [Spirochaetota bacterium]
MKRRTKTPEDARQFMRAVATHQGWALNPDDDFLADLAEGLAHNYNAYGYFLCPCRDGDAEREADRDIICPCDYAKPDIQEHGHCFCGLFLSHEFAAGDGTPQPIPERRAGGI